MADIQSAAQWLGRLLLEEAKYLSRVANNVRELQDELEWMLCFLKDADAIQYDNIMARRWVAQIREFAYEAEDTIEQFLVRVDTTSRRRDLLSPVRRYSRIVKKFISLHKIGSKIDSLKHKISLLSSKLHTYGIKLRMGDESSSRPLELRDKHYLGSVEKQLVGRGNELQTMVYNLVEKKDKRVFSIFGVGGVGKTFLAKKIYQEEKIRRYFDVFAWAYVSQPFQSSAVQQDLLSSLTSKSKVQIAQMTDFEMKNELCKVQRKQKCFVVLDGIWGNEVWDSLKHAFPVTSHDFKSKLLITTRLKEVALSFKTDAYTFELNYLSDEYSKELLNEKLKGAPHLKLDEDSMKLLKEKEILRDAPTEQNQPPSLNEEDSRNHSLKKNSMTVKDLIEDLKEDMLKRCKGLPLAISVLGGVLATKRTLREWCKVETDISLDMNDVEPWRRILELSYYDLPYQLKPSFLYLGYFPTNLEIPTTKIIRLWEAEGLVSLSGDDETSEETLEDVAEKCLSELVERSLVQVGSRGLTGKAKTCRVHDLMRDLCMDKAKQGNWLNIVKFGVDEDGISGTPSSKHHKKSKPVKKYRRLAIYYSRTSGKLPGGRQARYIRSLLFFNTLATEEVLISLKKMFLEKIFTDYKLLRVVDIGNIEIQSLPRNVGSLIHLRYLSISGSWVSKLPSSIGNLRCLQTLDLRVLSFVRVRIPDVLWKMERLIHLYLPTLIDDTIHLTNLHKLETLVNFSNKCRAKDLANLDHLRKFSSCDYFFERESIEPFLKSPITKLKHIEHLSLKLEGVLLNQISQTLVSCKKLYVKNELPASFKFHIMLPQLIKLSVSNIEFQTDPLEVLGQLTCLKKLSLKQCRVRSTTMNCSKKGLMELEYLTLESLMDLENWTVEEAALPKLSHLKIFNCQKLKMIPYVKSLKVLEISYMPYSFFNKLNPHQEIENWVNYHEVKHVPYLKISNVLELVS